MSGLVGVEVLRDIAAQQRWATNGSVEAPMDLGTSRDDVRRISLVKIYRTATKKGVKCRHLGGDKRAPHCSFEETCDGDPCLLPLNDNMD